MSSRPAVQEALIRRANQPVVELFERALAALRLTPYEASALIFPEKPGHTTLYGWLKGNNLPGPEMRARISQGLGIDARELAAAVERSRAAQKGFDPGPARSLVVAEPAQPAEPPALPLNRPFSFEVRQDGTARIAFDVTLPINEAWRLVDALRGSGLLNIRGGPESV